MGKIIFITGGARSGKSRLAETLAIEHGEPLLYLATARAGDGEMTARIRRHQERRGDVWQTIEEPCDLLPVLHGHDGWFKAVLVDCVTLWLTNLLLDDAKSAGALDRVRELVQAAAGWQTPLILVANEVGMGIVPDNELARRFRDLAGEANEILAAAADEAYVMFSGLPLKLK
jgi:adenosylcobinamide kinase/adenosylcobinamide-phosphate guanylyltransferase